MYTTLHLHGSKWLLQGLLLNSVSRVTLRCWLCASAHEHQTSLQASNRAMADQGLASASYHQATCWHHQLVHVSSNKLLMQMLCLVNQQPQRCFVVVGRALLFLCGVCLLSCTTRQCSQGVCVGSRSRAFPTEFAVCTGQSMQSWHAVLIARRLPRSKSVGCNSIRIAADVNGFGICVMQLWQLRTLRLAVRVGILPAGGLVVGKATRQWHRLLLTTLCGGVAGFEWI